MPSNFIFIFILLTCRNTYYYYHQGDSGSGIICEKKLSAIVSFGHDCGDAHFPGVHTSINAYKEFIDKVLTIKYTRKNSGLDNQSNKITHLSNMPILIVVVTIGMRFG